MNKEEEILKVIKKSGKKGLSLREIVNRTNLPREEVYELLDKLCKRLQLHENKQNRFMTTEDEHHFSGTLAMSEREFGFLIPNDVEAVKRLKYHSSDSNNKDRIFIKKSELNGALHEDRILVETYTLADGRVFGKVIERVPSYKRHVGIIYMKNGKYYAKMDSKKYPFPVVLEDTRGGAVDSKVVVKIYPEKVDGEYHGTVVHVLGHLGDPGVDVLSIVAELGVPYGENSKADDEANLISDTVSEDQMEGRLDLRNEMIFTIDGKDAKDFDDAVSIKKKENGNYVLGVHIADVSEYIKEHSELDKEAYMRGTSVYLADRVIPMLPHKISDGICSLVEGEDRLTISVFMEIDANGNVVNYDIKKSVINSKKRMRYDEVNMLLDGCTVPGYENQKDDLMEMQALSKIIRAKKEKNGTISFDKDEIKLKIDADGVAIDVDKRERGEAERIIEDFMISANITVAGYLRPLVDSIYRVHEEPDKDKLEKMNEILSTIGCELKLPDVDRPLRPIEFQKALNEYKNDERYGVISSVALRAMKKAHYSSEHEMHFALAAEDYTHFTSPIRRYPDLIVHRILSKVLNNTYDYSNTNKDVDYLKHACEHTSYCERRADDCERQVTQMKTAEFMQNKQKMLDDFNLGTEVYDGVITWIGKKGMYVELKNLVQGLIPSETMPNAEYKPIVTYVSPDITYKLGTPVKVILHKADKETRTIEFELADPNKIYEKTFF